MLMICRLTFIKSDFFACHSLPRMLSWAKLTCNPDIEVYFTKSPTEAVWLLNGTDEEIELEASELFGFSLGSWKEKPKGGVSLGQSRGRVVSVKVIVSAKDSLYLREVRRCGQDPGSPGDSVPHRERLQLPGPFACWAR